MNIKEETVTRRVIFNRPRRSGFSSRLIVVVAIVSVLVVGAVVAYLINNQNPDIPAQEHTVPV
jgi:hypothetical protein